MTYSRGIVSLDNYLGTQTQDPFWSNIRLSEKYHDIFVDGKVANGLQPTPRRVIRKSLKEQRRDRNDTR